MNRDVAEYLNFDGAEIERQKQLQEKHLQVVEPVAIPDDYGGTYACNSHLGWPVATMADDTLIVLFKGSGDDAGSHHASAEYLVRSEDGGKTWSDPIDLLENMKFSTAEGPNMRALGTNSTGKVIAIISRGLFVSEDKGRTWKHINSTGLPINGGIGPRIIDHPDHGLMFPAHLKRGGGYILSLFSSRDEGMSWNEIRPDFDSSEHFAPAEPTIFSWGNDFAIVSRNHSGHSTSLPNYFKSWSYFAQFTTANKKDPGRLAKIKLNAALTNMFVRRMDTMDVLYNPVSKRIEAVTPKRNEGFPYCDNGYQTLNLWSIDPEKFSRGHANWRFECVLLRSKGTFSKSYNHLFPPREGLHPGGSVVDEKRGMQHLFIFCGNRNHRRPNTGKTGIFRISRRLETDQLKKAIWNLDNLDQYFQIDEAFVNLNEWTVSGRPMGIQLIADSDRKVHAWNDVVCHTKDPLPNGVVEAGENGLNIRTMEPGYYGLHNEKSMVLKDYRLELKARVDRYAEDGDTLGINVSYGSQRQTLIFRKDGLYHLKGNDWKVECVKKIDMDGKWHVWVVEMIDEIAQVFLDEKHLADVPALLDDSLGKSGDVPVSIYSRTKTISDYANVRICRFKLANIIS